MSFARRFASLLALLAVVSLSVWTTGCADSSGKNSMKVDDKSGAKSPAHAPEAGSSTGGGTSVPGEK